MADDVVDYNGPDALFSDLSRTSVVVLFYTDWRATLDAHNDLLHYPCAVPLPSPCYNAWELNIYIYITHE